MEFVSNGASNEEPAGAVAAAMRVVLVAALAPVHLEFENESANHAGPATDSDFKLVLVAPDFEGLSRVKRHQRVYALLASFLEGGVHALSLHLHTPAEWEARGGVVAASPACAGRS